MIKKVLLLTTLIFQFVNSFAQVHFPVQVQPTVITSSVFLQDYADQSNFRVRVALNDLTKQNFSIRIKMTLSNTQKGFTATSNNGVVLTLNGGQVVQLSSSQLDSLFNPSDLGLNSDFVLSEGNYAFSFEAFAYNLPTLAVSNRLTDVTVTPVFLNDPPLLNLPLNNSEISDNANGFIQFSWMPRSFFTSPNRQVRYQLRVYKFLNPDLNPFQVIQNDNFKVLDVKDILSPVYYLSPSDLNLLPGTKYAWQVRAYENVPTNGLDSMMAQRFKNNGYSEVFTFSTKDHCPALSVDPQPATGSSPVKLTWHTDNTGGTPTEYEVQYREFGTALPFTIVRTKDTFLELDNTSLQQGLVYEFNVAVKCSIWQAPVYGGKFMLQKPNCTAPSPIKIDNPNTNGKMVLSWDADPDGAVSSYTFIYDDGVSPSQTIDLTTTPNTKSYSVELNPLTSGGYNVQVNALCGTTPAEGKKQYVAWNEKDFVGACPLPQPFTLTALRKMVNNVSMADITFSKSYLHQSYIFTYWPVTATQAEAKSISFSDSARVFVPDIPDLTYYHYTITFICSGNKNVTSGIGMFKIDPNASLDPNITPNTANCFPPAQLSAEARSVTSARFDWSGVSQANEYQLYYRLKGTSDPYQIFTTTASSAKLSGLKDSAIYEYKIKCRCGSDYSIESTIGTVDLSKPGSNAKCDTIAFVKVAKSTKSEIQLAWKYITQSTNTYNIFYKENSQTWADQYTINLPSVDSLVKNNVSGDTIKYTITNLKPSTKYNFKVQQLCGIENAQTNEPVTGQTLNDNSQGECGSSGACDRTSITFKNDLAIGDTIMVSDYKLVINEVQNIGGLYKGSGIASAPFVGLNEHITLSVEFDSMFVNDKACVTSGDVNMTEMTGNILTQEQKDKVTGLMNTVKSAVKTTKDALATASNVVNKADELTTKAMDYFQGGDNVGKVKDGGLKIDNTIDGVPNATNTAALTKPTLVKNTQNGDVYQVDASGNITKIGAFDPAYENLQSQGIKTVSGVTFKFLANSTAKWPYDTFVEGYKQVAMVDHYLKMGSNYCDAKLILPNELDKVDFTLTGGSKSKLKFVNRKGFVYDFDANTNTINLAGGPGSDAQEIMAVYDDNGTKKVIGCLLLASYTPVTKKVVLILTSTSPKLDKATEADIKSELNKIYGKVGVSYNVVIDDSFKGDITWQTTGTDFVIGSNTSLKNDYTDNCKSMIDAYIASRDTNTLDKTAAYLFLVVPKATEALEALAGKMNLGQQFGFLFNTQTQSSGQIAQTLAHELGHGNYLMLHIFDDIYLGSAATNSDNMMAYGNGSKLIKLQWDVIHDPGVNWGIGVDDGDQAAVANSNIEINMNVVDCEGDRSVKENDFIFISPSVEMPKLKIAITDLLNENPLMKLQLIVEYSRAVHQGPKMKQINYFPNQNSYIQINSGITSYEVNWNNLILGGTLWIIVKNADESKTLKVIKLYIRGKNPKLKDVIDYVNAQGYNQTYWFFSRIIRQESGSGNDNNAVAKHFNEPSKKSKYSATNYVGMPSFGTPNGWGLMQLDNKAQIVAELAELWSWKANVDKAKWVIDQKRDATISDMSSAIKDIKKLYSKDPTNVKAAKNQLEGKITFSHIKTSLSNFNTTNTYFAESTNVDFKSFIDANVIKRYNGGQYCRQKGRCADGKYADRISY